MRRSARQLGKAAAAPAGREGARTRASSSHSMADDDLELSLDDDESTADGSFSTRFSASRLRVIANRQSKKRKEVISKGSFGSLLNISSFSVLADLVDWVVMKIDPEKALFSHKKKSILFTKDMVRKIFNVPSGSRPVELLRRNEPHVLREPYRIGSRAPMKRTIDVLDGLDHTDVVTVNRTWVLLCIALVLSPGTGNMVPLEYLASLVDMDKISEFAWDEHFLAAALNEVKKYQKKRNEGKSGFWIGGCLPMFAIIYMDFVDVPRVLVSDHRIRYSLPRACFVCNEDFDFLEAIDKNNLSLDKTEFGKRNLRRLAETPYVPLEGCNEAHGHKNNVGGVSADAHIPEIPSNPAMDGCDIGGDVCGSLDEWLHPLPSSQDLEIPSHLIPIYEKHKKLHAVEVNNVMKTFGKVLQSMFCNRMASILVEANATTTSTKDHIPEDVTFHAPGGIASGAGHTRSPTNNVDEHHMSAEAQDVEFNREVAGSDSNQTEAHRDIGLDKMQSCDDQGKEFVQLGTDNVERERVAAAEDVVADLKDGGVADEGRSLFLSQGTMAALDGLAMEFDDGPSMSLFKEGTEDYEWLNMDAETAREYMEAKKCMETTSLVDAPADVEQPVSAGPTYDNTPQHAMESKTIELPVQNEADGPCFDTDPKLHRPIDIPAPVFDASPIALADPLVPPVIVPVQQGHSEAELHNVGEKTDEDSSPRSTLVKKAVKKRTAQPPDGVQKMKKIKIDRKDDALYQQYVLSRYKIPKPKKDQTIPDFIVIEGFHTSLQNFHASLKPRAEIDSEVMTLYLKTFNMEQLYNKKKPKKFAFSVFMGSQLAMDPEMFDPKNCEREFRRACENNLISKSDLLFITVVHNKHWAVVVVNLMHNQFNVFDSIKSTKDVTLMEKATNNVITNIKKVASCESAFKVDLNCFEKFNPVHPKQATHYNCGFYAILFLENFNGVVMSHFDESYIPNLRKRIAANLLKHPSNTLDPAEQLKKLLEL